MRSDLIRCCICAVALLFSTAWGQGTVPPTLAVPDPFRPSDFAPQPRSESVSEPKAFALKPQMIFERDGIRWAWVANQMVQEGDRIEDYLLIAIEPTRLVWLTPSGNERVEPLVLIPITPQEHFDGRTAP